MASPQGEQTRAGIFAALASFIVWGLSPVYWKQLVQVAPLEILSHRIVWSLIFVSLIIVVTRRWQETRNVFRSRKTLGILVCSSLLVGVNWLLYIWAVTSGHVLQASMGYYMNPLCNVFLGFVVFRDRLRPMQWIAIALAAAGVLNMLILLGELPWVSIALAVSFAFYGLLRKIVQVESIPGLMVETMLLAPIAGAYLFWLAIQGEGSFLHISTSIDWYLIGGGIVTSAPLMGFAFGARRIRLTTLGLIQYVAPSIAFVLGVFVYNEPFGSAQLATFACIWAALAVYTFEGGWYFRRNHH